MKSKQIRNKINSEILWIKLIFKYEQIWILTSLKSKQNTNLKCEQKIQNLNKSKI
jgi:hypothetical protein